MRRIIRRREIVADSARYPGEQLDASTDALSTGTVTVQPLADFLADARAAHPGAVLLGPTDEVERLAPHLQHVDLVVIDFPKPGDGRGFSQARLLRERYNYAGELRARGALKRDQLFFLARCGFDSFDLDPTEDLAAALGALDTFSVAYQEGSDELVCLGRRQLS